jgi:hypothetical protein
MIMGNNRKFSQEKRHETSQEHCKSLKTPENAIHDIQPQELYFINDPNEIETRSRELIKDLHEDINKMRKDKMLLFI